MLEQTHQQILSETARRIFEEAAFALEDPPEIEVDIKIPDEFQLACAVVFFGPMTGIMMINAPDGLARALAANMMGLNDRDAYGSEKPIDALGEILNMICGNLLPAIAGVGPEFQINAPQQMSVAQMRQIILEQPRKMAVNAHLFIEGSKTEIALLMDTDKECGC